MARHDPATRLRAREQAAALVERWSRDLPRIGTNGTLFIEFGSDDLDELRRVVTEALANAFDLRVVVRPRPLVRELLDDEVAGHRSFGCGAYDICLEHAAAEAWRGMSCSECPGPREEVDHG